MKKLSIFIIFLMLFLTSCSKNNSSNINKISKIQIVTSIPPIASIANFIGGKTIQVNNIIEPGFSPHSFDLKPSDLIKINNADIIITTGLSIDNFLQKSIKNKNNLILKNYVDLLEGEDKHHHEEKIQKKDYIKKENKNHSDEIFFDPHIWLSLKNGNKIAESIKNKLIELQPENKDIYNINYKNFLQKSQKIKNNFSKNINNKNQQKFIIEHEAYNYLFQEINIDINKILILSETAGENPSVSQMKNIIDYIKKNNIKIVYKEPQVDSKIINTLSKKYNLKILELDPLGKSNNANGYFENIQTNLNNLSEIYE